jgi:hypothetical protein
MGPEMETCGYRFFTEARPARGDTLHGVFHVLSYADEESFDPPVVVIVPGKWNSEAEAHRAAEEYAAVMADDGALRQAVNLRLLACRKD